MAAAGGSLLEGIAKGTAAGFHVLHCGLTFAI